MSYGWKLTRASARSGFPLMSLAKQYRRLYFWLFQSGFVLFLRRGGNRSAASSIGATSLAIVLQLRFNCKALR